MFYARVLCGRFRLKNWIVHLFSSFEIKALRFSNYTSHDRHNCRPKKYFPRNAHVEIQIKALLLSVEFFTSFSLRPSRQSTHATALVAENISDSHFTCWKAENIYISVLHQCFDVFESCPLRLTFSSGNSEIHLSITTAEITQVKALIF